MKPIRKLPAFLLGSSLLGAVSTVSAQTWTGGGADANWTTAGNWTGGTPDTSGTGTSTVTFYNTGAGKLTNSTGGRYNLNQIAFNAGASSAVTINVTASPTALTSGTAIRFNAGTNISVATGNHKIVGTGVNSGSSYDMIFNGAANSTHTFDIGSGASFEIQGRIHHGATTDKNYAKTGAGTMILSGANGGSGGWGIASTKAFQIQQGALRFAAANAAGLSGTNYEVSNDAALELSGGFTQALNNGKITLNGTGIGSGGALRSLSGTNTITAANTATGTVILNTDSSIGVDAGTLTIKKVISGGGSLAKVGVGTLVLEGIYSDNTTTFANSFTGATTISAGTLEVRGSIATSSSITNNAALVFNSGSAQAYANAIDGNGTLTKSGAGTLTLSGGGTMSGNLIVSGGTVQLGATNGISTSAGLEIFGGASATRILDLNGYNQTLAKLVFTAANSDGNLTINGTGTSKLTVNTTTDTEFGPGGAIATSTKTAHINLSGLNEFAWNGAANTFRVGIRTGATNLSGGITGDSTVILATTNTITAATLAIGTTAANNNGGTSVLRLGQANALNANTIAIGNGGRNNATLEFNTGLTSPTATIRGTAGGTSRVTTWDVGRVVHFGNSTWEVAADFSGGTLDARVASLRLGRAESNAANRAGTLNATFRLGKGTLDVTDLTVGQYLSSGATPSVVANGTLAGNGIFNLDDATGTVIAENITLADNIGNATLNSGSAANVSGTFNLLAGTVEAKTIGKGLDTGNATTATRNFNFTSGTIRNYAGSNLTISDVPINLTGSGSRDFEATAGRTITVAASSVISGSAQGFTKTGEGSLVLAGANTYSGDTTVSAGSLFVSGALSNSAVTVESNGTIGSGGIAGTLGNGLTIQSGGNLDLTGATLGLNSTGIPVLTGGNLTLGNLTFQDLVGWDWANADVGTYELIDGAFSINWGSTAYLNAQTAYDFNNGKKGYFTSGSLNVVVIPEPRAALLGGLGLLALLRRRRA